MTGLCCVWRVREKESAGRVCLERSCGSSPQAPSWVRLPCAHHSVRVPSAIADLCDGPTPVRVAAHSPADRDNLVPAFQGFPGRAVSPRSPVVRMRRVALRRVVSAVMHTRAMPTRTRRSPNLSADLQCAFRTTIPILRLCPGIRGTPIANGPTEPTHVDPSAPACRRLHCR